MSQHDGAGQAAEETAAGAAGARALDAAAPGDISGVAWNRVAIERLSPRIDGGRFPIKRIAGDPVAVEAAIVADGHEVVSAVVLHRRAEEGAWTEVPMEPLGDDRFRAEFAVTAPGRHVYTVLAWVDRFRSWATDLGKRLDAAQDVTVELLIGIGLIEKAAERAQGADHESLAAAATMLRSGGVALARSALDPGLAALMVRHGDRPFAARHKPDLEVVVDRERARFGAWYELFPRSASPEPGRHGTFARRRGPPPGHRRDGLRRALPAADPPDRPGQPQGPEQPPGRRPGRSRQPVGDRQRRGRPQGGPSRARHARGLRAPASTRPRATASRSRSTSRSSARPTTPT